MALGTAGNPRIALSLNRLRKQLDEAFPDRDTSWDGDIGDDAHRQRASDHNPHNGTVTAWDFTDDPEHGVSGDAIAEAIRLSKDPRVKHVIHKGRIFSSTNQPWVWRPRNKGPDDHAYHVHVSVGRGPDGHTTNPELYDDPSPWSLPGKPAAQGQSGKHKSQYNVGITATRFCDRKPDGSPRVAYAGIPRDYCEEPGAALPANLGANRKHLWVRRGAITAREVPNVDVGPWNDNPPDPYWETFRRPQAESGVDLKGRRTNHAGIDLTPALDRLLGCGGKCVVDWGFEPMEDDMANGTNPQDPQDQKLDEINKKLEDLKKVLDSPEGRAVRKGVMRLVWPFLMKALPMLGIQGGIWVFVLNIVAQTFGWVDTGGTVDTSTQAGAAGIFGSGFVTLLGRGLDRLAKVLDKVGGAK